MKSYNSLYAKVCSIENLQLAFKKARRGKTRKPYVISFEANLNRELQKLKTELETFSYVPRPLKTFVIRDPKTRVISASDFRDRIIHHALCNILEPIFEKTFIYDSYASRKNKGTHKAIKRFDEFKRKTAKNGKLVKYAKTENEVVGYVLKADIRHYFDSVNHEILLAIINRKIRDKGILWLIKKILDNHSNPSRGMPIGNLTSQLFANVYLNELDHFVKHTLRAKYYIRYLDDFVILDRNREKLKYYKSQINEFLKTLKLELHPDKSKIIPLHNGINFLGFRIFYHYKLLKKSNTRLFYKRMKNLEIAYKNEELSREELLENIEGWLAYARYGNTYRLRRSVAQRLYRYL